MSHSAANERDAAYAAFLSSSVPEELDGFRSSVISLDADRERATQIATGAVIAAGALGTWALLEWMFVEPSVGRIEGPDITPVEGDLQ